MKSINQMNLPNVRIAVKTTSVTPPSITGRYQCTTQADMDVGYREWFNTCQPFTMRSIWMSEWTRVGKGGFWGEWWMNEEMKSYVSQKVKSFILKEQHERRSEWQEQFWFLVCIYIYHKGCHYQNPYCYGFRVEVCILFRLIFLNIAIFDTFLQISILKANPSLVTHLAILHCHKDEIDNFDLALLCN